MSHVLIDLPLLLFVLFVIAGRGLPTELFNYDIEILETFFFHHLLQYEALILINNGLSDKVTFDVPDEFLNQGFSGFN